MWHYRPCRRKDLDGSYYYVVVEYYKVGRGTKPMWTELGCSPMGNSRKELIRDLEMMLADCKKRRTLDDTKINK